MPERSLSSAGQKIAFQSPSCGSTMGVMVDNSRQRMISPLQWRTSLSAEIAFTADMRGDGRETYVVDSAVITGRADWLLPAISLTFSILVWAIRTWLL